MIITNEQYYISGNYINFHENLKYDFIFDEAIYLDEDEKNNFIKYFNENYENDFSDSEYDLYNEIEYLNKINKFNQKIINKFNDSDFYDNYIDLYDLNLKLESYEVLLNLYLDDCENPYLNWYDNSDFEDFINYLIVPLYNIYDCNIKKVIDNIYNENFEIIPKKDIIDNIDNNFFDDIIENDNIKIFELEKIYNSEKNIYYLIFEDD